LEDLIEARFARGVRRRLIGLGLACSRGRTRRCGRRRGLRASCQRRVRPSTGLVRPSRCTVEDLQAIGIDHEAVANWTGDPARGFNESARRFRLLILGDRELSNRKQLLVRYLHKILSVASRKTMVMRRAPLSLPSGLKANARLKKLLDGLPSSRRADAGAFALQSDFPPMTNPSYVVGHARGNPYRDGPLFFVARSCVRSDRRPAWWAWLRNGRIFRWQVESVAEWRYRGGWLFFSREVFCCRYLGDIGKCARPPSAHGG